MEDTKIVELFWNRSEQGPEELQKKYSGFLFRLAMNLLEDREDSEECVNDTYLRTWNSIPENRPNDLRLYTGRITRNLALDRLRRRTALRRGEQVTAVLDELQECIPAVEDTESEYNYRLLVREINAYIGTLDDLHACVFVRRYWQGEPVARIAEFVAIPEKTVTTYLFRMRRDLKERLEAIGFVI